MDFDLMLNSFPKLLNATLVTLKLLSLSLITGLFLGFCFARPVYDARRNILDARLITLIEQFPDNCTE